MASLYITIILCVLFLFFAVKSHSSLIALPSYLHTLTWLIASFLIFLQVTSNGNDGLEEHAWIEYQTAVRYIMWLVISSIFGFVLADGYVKKKQKNLDQHLPFANIIVINSFLKRFRWVLYVSCILGGITITVIGLAIGFNNIEDYRIYAVTAERVGIAALAMQFSGHFSILGNFFITVVGFKHGLTRVNIKEFFLYGIMYAASNIAIAGRGWIISLMVPYFIGFLMGYSYNNKPNRGAIKSNIKYLLIIFVFLASFFSLFGRLRNESEGDKSFIQKFYYYTDGAYMSNMVLEAFPRGSYPLEYGKCEFLSKWIESPMTKRFDESISDDIALSCTVQSSIPSLYYDYGYTGGILMWGVFCFILQAVAIRFSKPNTFFQLFLYYKVTSLLFQAPIGPVFYMETVPFIWLGIIYIFRKRLFTFNRVYC